MTAGSRERGAQSMGERVWVFSVPRAMRRVPLMLNPEHLNTGYRVVNPIVKASIMMSLRHCLSVLDSIFLSNPK
jgi:hypothetical protein